ncbi:MAG: TAXI family TRAP transporter solute-binding subunit [Trueperaceae bacterium]|nr:TAXI family TRAP transporter solute-binding subunit [Trueperaceae bacterium]
MKKLFVSLFITAMLIMAMLASLGFAQRQLLIIGTGGVTGVYYPVGGTVAKIVNDASVGLRLTVESTSGSIFNVMAMSNDQLDLALAQSDVVYQAYNGEEVFDGNPIEALRTVMGLHPEPLHLVCAADAGVETLPDIRGLRINIGNQGSGIRSTALTVLGAYGIDLADFQAESVRAAEAPDLLRDGRIDCFFYTIGIGGAAIQDIATTNDITLVPLDDEVLEPLIEASPYYAFATVPGGTYSGVREDVTIFGVKALFVTTADLSEQTVYTIVDTVLDNLGAFRATHPAVRDLTPQDFVSGLGAPLHPGAERAYREAGVIGEATSD